MGFVSEIIWRQKFLLEKACHLRDCLIVVLEGSFSCTMEGKTFVAERNDVCVFPKGVRFDRKVIQPIRCVLLQFSALPMPLGAGKLDLRDGQRAESTVAYLVRAVENKDQELVLHYLRDLIFLSRPEECKPEVRDTVVAECIARLHSTYAQKISLEQLAEEQQLSPQGLIRRFRRSTDMTPMEYLGQVRLHESKILLRSTDLMVSQVAEACGFDNVYYFSNFFRKKMGMSPTQYRQTLEL